MLHKANPSIRTTTKRDFVHDTKNMKVLIFVQQTIFVIRKVKAPWSRTGKYKSQKAFQLHPLTQNFTECKCSQTRRPRNVNPDIFKIKLENISWKLCLAKELSCDGVHENWVGSTAACTQLRFLEAARAADFKENHIFKEKTFGSIWRRLRWSRVNEMDPTSRVWRRFSAEFLRR